jgi:hypothetical protein
VPACAVFNFRRPAVAAGCRFSNQDNFPVPLQHTRPGGQRNIDFSDSTGRSRAVMRFHRWVLRQFRLLRAAIAA